MRTTHFIILFACSAFSAEMRFANAVDMKNDIKDVAADIEKIVADLDPVSRINKAGEIMEMKTRLAELEVLTADKIKSETKLAAVRAELAKAKENADLKDAKFKIMKADVNASMNKLLDESKRFESARRAHNQNNSSSFSLPAQQSAYNKYTAEGKRLMELKATLEARTETASEEAKKARAMKSSAEAAKAKVAALEQIQAALETHLTDLANRISKAGSALSLLADACVLQGKSPTVNMDVLYTDEDVRDAKLALQRLLIFKQGLESRLVEIAKWRNDNNNDLRQFEAIRAETIQRDLSDILEAIPAADIVNEFSKSVKYSKYITPQLALQFELAYRSLSSQASANTALTATDDSKKFEKTVSATTEMSKAIIAIRLSKMPDGGDKKFIEAMSTIIDSMGKVAVFMHNKNDEQWSQQAAGLTLDIASTLPGAIGIIATFGVDAKNECARYRKKQIVNEAIESLGGAVSANWNAELKLRERLDRVNSDIDEEMRILQGHALAHP